MYSLRITCRVIVFIVLQVVMSLLLLGVSVRDGIQGYCFYCLTGGDVAMVTRCIG